MNRKIIQILPIFILITLLFYTHSLLTALGQSAESEPASTKVINREIKQLNDEIGGKKTEIKKLEQQQQKYSDAIKQKQSEKASLDNQLAILENRVSKAELDLELARTEGERIQLEISKTDKEIEDRNGEILREKNKIANILKIVNQKGNTSSLEILLLNDSLSEFMSQVKYLEDVNASVKDSLDNLKNLKRQLDKDKAELENQNKELAKLKEDLAQKKDALEAEKSSKVMIVSQISISEREYQRLLEQTKKEQEDAASEIASMEKLVRAKFASLEGNELEMNDNGLVWPVKKNTITAYFHDPDYPFKHIFEHPAVDIRAGQGTTLKAAASGYVARVKNGGVGGYSYIMLVHGDGLSTVYGHVSKSYIAEDEYVVQGQTIGLSGGLPGTPGAGNLTTGPHLHFEVRLNGIPVDPLSYLP